MSWFYCSDDEVRKILERKLSDVDALVEIIKVKANSYGSLFVHVPPPECYYFSNIILEIVSHDTRDYFKILPSKQNSFCNIRERTYYKSTCYSFMYFYNIFLEVRLMKDFVKKIMMDNHFMAKSLITMQLGAKGVNVIHELSSFLK